MPPRTPEPPDPTFLIIGAQRCATRWLKFNLDQHPDIYVPPFELSFFDDPAKLKKPGMRGYRRQFEGWDGEPITGEGSPSYMTWANQPTETAKRIQSVLPDVKIIALLRNPIERSLSALRHYVKRGRLPADADLMAMIHNSDPDLVELDLLGGSIYHASLSPFWQRFGDQVLVLFCDDIEIDAPWVYETALAHIGASTDFIPRDIDRVRFSNQHSVRLTGPPLDDDQRRELFFWFRTDVERLQETTGRDLSAWVPGKAVDDSRIG